MTAAKLANIALKQVVEVLDKLTDEQLTDLAEGRASFEFRSIEVVVKAKAARAPRKAAAPLAFDVDEVVGTIRTLESAADVTAYLESKKLKLTELRAVAKAIGPTVVQQGSKIVDVIRNIAEGTAGFRERAAARGTWQSR